VIASVCTALALVLAAGDDRQRADASAGDRAAVSVIVRAAAGHATQVEELVEARGARVERRLPIIDGLAVRVERERVDDIARTPGVVQVVENAALRFAATHPAAAAGIATRPDFGSLHEITRAIGAHASWRAGYTGKGVDVALLDTGVSAVPGLTSGNVVNGPDLSFDSQDADRHATDGYGHGTHMASIIAGRDRSGRPASYTNPDAFAGVAPDARIVNVKVGAADGAADVSQVIAAIDWVVQHRRDPGFNIRVLSLSFGTDATQDYRLDPLAYAAERAWRSGVVVVAAAGNDGPRIGLANPAMDPLVLAVGASDPNGTATIADDSIPDFANRGTARRHVDVVAPGVHVLGLRCPSSTVDAENPDARVGTRWFRGSGTSQATAVTAGAVALFLQHRPQATPDQVKRAFTSSAVPLPKVPVRMRGSGRIDVRRAQLAPLGRALQQSRLLDGVGLGTLEGARGTYHVTDGAVELAGEQDIFGAPWNPLTWAAATRAGRAWNGGTWNGNQWTGDGWTGSSWATRTWAIVTWAAPWNGRRWTAGNWAGRRWTTGPWAVGAWR
jgi:serine protease AprX